MELRKVDVSNLWEGIVMQTTPERLRELADEIERKQTPPQPFADQADEALYLQSPPQASVEKQAQTESPKRHNKSTIIADTIENFLNVPSKENIEKVVNAMTEYRTAWVTTRASEIKGFI